MTENRTDYAKVVAANVAVHTKMAAHYNAQEPHFRDENVARVRSLLTTLVEACSARSLLDLGCGTGFIIDIVRPLVREVHGVDITQAMLDQVDLSGPARITLTCADTAEFVPAESAFDLVTSYSFLHHLYDIRPTLRTAYRALRPGGRYYADLEPNQSYWHALATLDFSRTLNPVVRLEVEKTRFHDHEVATRLGVPKETLDCAEHGKNIRGGFSEDALVTELEACGFHGIEVFYYWFIGQSQLINSHADDRPAQLSLAEEINKVLQGILPLSRPLYKYLGFVATK